MLVPFHVFNQEQVGSLHRRAYLLLAFALLGACPFRVARVTDLEGDHEVARCVSIEVAPDLVRLIDAPKIVGAFVDYLLGRLVHRVKSVGRRLAYLLSGFYEIISLARSAGDVGENEIVCARRPALHHKLKDSNLRIRGVQIAHERCGYSESLLLPKAVVLISQGVLITLLQDRVARPVPESDELCNGVSHDEQAEDNCDQPAGTSLKLYIAVGQLELKEVTAYIRLHEQPS